MNSSVVHRRICDLLSQARARYSGDVCCVPKGIYKKPGTTGSTGIAKKVKEWNTVYLFIPVFPVV